MKRSCNFAISITVYLFIRFWLFGRFFCRTVTTCGARHGEEQSTTERRAKWVGLGWVQSFMLILGQVRSGHKICGSGWVGPRKLDPRLTLIIGLSAVCLQYTQ